MKHCLFLLFAGAALFANSGCCCLGHRWYTFHRALHCHDCGGHAAHSCGSDCSQGCGDTCGHSHGDTCGEACVNKCGDSCGQTCGHGCDSGHSGWNWGWGSSGCSILGCSSHYLDPKGAHYGAYCGTCCEKGGCGPRYWGDWFNVPRTSEPCDCCANFVGPSHSYHGSTPWYYGPPPQYPNPGYGSHSLSHTETVVSEEIVSDSTTTTNGSPVAAKPRPAKTK